MAIYAIGDVQGCYNELMQLLDKIQFSEQKDTLWFVGDLVNRGPNSLLVLRFIQQLSNKVVVLGNHDLHLLALHYLHQPQGAQDTLNDVLQADDCDALCHWLSQQPLLHHDAKQNYTLVHAGIHPHWHLDTAKMFSQEIHTVLTSSKKIKYFQNMYGNTPLTWQDNLPEVSRWRFITNVFTRMRFLTKTGELNLDYKGTLKHAPNNLVPWFKLKRAINSPIIFGHWAALNGQNLQEKNIYPIDYGCVWGNRLTAMRLTDQALFHFASESKV